MKRSNLFLVGATKSGNTSVYWNLKEHPSIYFPDLITPNYFCKDLRNNIGHEDKNKLIRTYYDDPIKTIEEYESLYKKCKDEIIIGDASSGRYLYSKVAAEEIYKYHPQAKIFIMLRNPLDFLRAIHGHFVSHLAENITDLKEALAAEEARKKGVGFAKGALCKPLFFYSEMVKFSEQIERYQRIFSKEQIKIVLLDDLILNKEKFYKEILEWLGVDEEFKPSFKHHNQHKELRSKHFMILQKFPYFWKPIKSIVPRRMYMKLRYLIFKRAKREPLKEEFKLQLMKQLKPEVEKLSELLKRDLVTLWSYDNI